MAISSFQDSTLHGLFYMSKAKSKRSFIFWLIITCMTLIFATVQVAREIGQILSDVKFTAQYRAITEVEIEALKSKKIFVFFSNWMDAIDWNVVGEAALELNLTANISVELVRHFKWLNLTNNSDRNKLINEWISQSRDISDSANVTAQKVETFLDLVKLEVPVFCSPEVIAQFTGHTDPVRFSCPFPEDGDIILIKQNKKPGEFLDSILKYDYNNSNRLVLFIPETNILHSYRDISNQKMVAVEIISELSNYPEYEERMCRIEPIDFKGIKKRGIDCFEWNLRLTIRNELSQLWSSSYGLNKECMKIFKGDFSCTVILFVTPSWERYAVKEYAPLFKPYTIIANIGGILGVWTGASALSLVHLLVLFIRKIFPKSDVVPQSAYPKNV